MEEAELTPEQVFGYMLRDYYPSELFTDEDREELMAIMTKFWMWQEAALHQDEKLRLPSAKSVYRRIIVYDVQNWLLRRALRRKGAAP